MVKKLAVASLALSALAMSFVAPAAQAGPATPGPDGRKCSYAAVSDPAPDADENAMTGQANAGPLVWDRAFSVQCIVQVDSNLHNGTSNDADSISCSAQEGPPGTWTVQCEDTLNYISGEESQDYLCTQVTYSGGTLYWHPTDPGPDGIAGTPDDGEAGHWTTDPNTPCSAADQQSTGPIIDLLNELIFEPLDALLICPALKAARPVVNAIAPGLVFIDAEGDLFIDLNGNGIFEADAENDIFWDCPFYIGRGDETHGTGIIDLP
jgi:hypothetical protein